MEREKHKLVINERNSLEMTDICEIISFNENALELCLSDCSVQITGEKLKIEHISVETGKIRVLGKIISVYYPEETKRKGLFGNIL